MAELLTRAGNPVKFDNKSLKMSFETEVFSTADFVQKVATLTENPKYKQSGMKMRAISRMTGGASTAVSTIEAAYLHYSGAKSVERDGVKLIEATHLVDNNYYKVLQGHSWCKLCCGLYCILPALIIYVLLAGFDGIINMVQAE